MEHQALAKTKKHHFLGNAQQRSPPEMTQKNDRTQDQKRA
jgi:hypothetical protein